MTIKVEVKNVYGNERIYPKSHISEIEALTGQKTLSRKHINALIKLGINFKTEQVTL